MTVGRRGTVGTCLNPNLSGVGSNPINSRCFHEQEPITLIA